MAENPLFDSLGRDACCGAKVTLLSLKGERRAGELVSEEFIRRLNPGTVFVSVGRSIAALRKQGAAVSHVFWVDATGDLFWNDSPEKSEPNFSFTEGPAALQHLSMLLATMASSGAHNFFVLDSLDALLAKNGQDKTAKFAQFLVRKFKSLSVGALFVIRDSKKAGLLAKAIGKEFDRKEIA